MATKRKRARKNPEKRLIDAIRPGDRVTIVDRFGKERTGRATIIVPGSHVVLNMGGAHGTPAIATDSNVTRVKPAAKGKSGGFVFRNPKRKTAPRARSSGNPLPMYPIHIRRSQKKPWLMIAVARTDKAGRLIARALAQIGYYVKVTDAKE